MFGRELILDLHGCDVSTFTRDSITRYFEGLCDLIDMRRMGLHFWDDDELPPEAHGISAVQFIATSSIVIHVVDAFCTAYINIFSCRDFDTDDARAFSMDWFKSDGGTFHIVERE